MQKIKRISVSLLKTLSLLCVFYMFAVFASDIHHDYIRNKVGSEVVEIVDPDIGGGTGFHVEAKSGITYIMTNNHICEMKKSDGTIPVKAEGNSSFIDRRVIFTSKDHDICLIEAIPGHKGIKLASNADVGETIAIVGYPNLRPLTVSFGEIIDKDKEITIPQFIIFSSLDEQKCKAKIITIQSIFGVMKYCVVSDRTYQVAAISFPGNSGSPVVNKYGNVIGLLFAGNGSVVNDTYLVKLEYLKEVLDLY